MHLAAPPPPPTNPPSHPKVFNLDAAINLRPHKCAPLQYLVDTYKGLFSLTNDYSYLTLASSTLQRFLTNIPPSPNTAYLFPTVIFNLATVYESFGAFEGALDLYGRILELFPTYDKYQLVLYRTVVVMLHLSGLKGAERGQLLQKCVEMVQFINESQADESELNKEHLLLVFARVMMKLDEHLKVDFNEKMVSCVEESGRGPQRQSRKGASSATSGAKRRKERGNRGGVAHGSARDIMSSPAPLCQRPQPLVFVDWQRRAVKGSPRSIRPRIYTPPKP